MKRRARRSRCQVCGGLYWPDQRAKGRQQTCGRRECQEERHRRADCDWHAQHPEYDVARRLRALRERLERCEEVAEVVRGESPPVCALPSDEVQEELGTNGLAILMITARLLSQQPCLEIIEKFGN
jgi:hypothetical protein